MEPALKGEGALMEKHGEAVARAGARGIGREV